MSRRLWYAAALALLLLADRGTDIGKLRPVELVQLMEEKGILILRTDTGDAGWGLTVEQAVAKLKENTPGQIYLDTADYLLLDEGTEMYLPQMAGVMKKTTRMAYAEPGGDLQNAVSYMRVHQPSSTLKSDLKPKEKLIWEGGQMNMKKIQE